MAFVDRSSFQASLQQARAEPVVPLNARAVAAQAATPTEAPKAVRPPVAKQHCVPSVAEYRGATAAANIRNSKNYSTDAAHTSLPMQEVPKSMSTRRQPNDITAHQTNALLTGFGSVFSKDTAKTGKGWKPGKF